MKYLIWLLLLTTGADAADIYLYSTDGKPIAGYEFSDLSVTWLAASQLAPNAKDRVMPISHFKDPTKATGWAYCYGRSVREIRAAYRKAGGIKTPGRYTVVLSTASWCSPCARMKKEGFYESVLKVADLEVNDIDVVNPFGVKSVPTVHVFNADNREVKVLTGYTTIDTINRIIK